IFQIGQGVMGVVATVTEPPVYRLPCLSPVNPSMARGVVIRVVNVALCGKDRLSLSSSPQAKMLCKPPGANLGASAKKITVNSRKTVREIDCDLIVCPPSYVACF